MSKMPNYAISDYWEDPAKSDGISNALLYHSKKIQQGLSDL